MKIPLRGLDVHFPFETVYPEQLRFMQEVMKLLNGGGHGLIEMPCGTGKTISILSILVSWKIQHGSSVGKVVYCTRTTNELDKVLEELQRLVESIMKDAEAESRRSGRIGDGDAADPCPVLGVGLAARKTLCLNTDVNRHPTSSEVDAGCFARTGAYEALFEAAKVEGGDGAAAMRDIEETAGPRCTYYDTALSDTAPAKPLPKGIYTLESIRAYGEEKKHCPYWLARWALDSADIVVLSYPYIIDERVAEHISDSFPAGSVVIFDEAHNIDNICMEALSFTVTKGIIRRAKEQAKTLQRVVRAARQSDTGRLEQEYTSLVSRNATQSEGTPLANATEPIPGNMRKAEHFAGLLRRLCDYFDERFARRTTRIEVQTPKEALQHIRDQVMVSAKQLTFTQDRMRMLMRTLREGSETFRDLQLMVHLVTTLGTYENEGFKVVTEPEEATASNTHWDSAYSLVCCDASIAMRHVFQKYRSVILTSGTLSPLSVYANILGFSPAVSTSLKMTMVRQCAYPMIVTRGADQQSLSAQTESLLSTSFKTRTSSENSEVVRNYGSFLLELCQVVPDGIVCFFTSYRYMEEVVSTWEAIGILAELTKEKLVFVETKSISETEAAMANYRHACDVGRGGLFMSIARGKVAEGVDFDGHYGRAVVVFGVPYLPPDDQALNARLTWLEENRQIPQDEYRSFDAMRQTSQCLGRVLRNKKDYGLMVLADRRYLQDTRRKLLPLWILEAGLDNPQQLNLSADVAVNMAGKWLTTMAQPTDLKEELGRSLLSSEDVVKALDPAMQPPPSKKARTGRA